MCPFSTVTEPNFFRYASACALSSVPQPHGFQIHHVYQPDEVRTLLLETVPTSALAALSITLKELFSVVVQHVVLSRHIEDIFGLRAFQNLVDRIEFLRL